jgi:hypothetical protein
LQSAIAHLLAHPVTVESKPKRSKYDPRNKGVDRQKYMAEYVAKRMETDPAYRTRRYAAIKAYKARQKEKRRASIKHDKPDGHGEPAETGQSASRGASGTGSGGGAVC